MDAFKVPFNILDYIFNPCEYGEAGCLPAYMLILVLLSMGRLGVCLLICIYMCLRPYRCGCCVVIHVECGCVL